MLRSLNEPIHFAIIAALLCPSLGSILRASGEEYLSSNKRDPFISPASFPAPPPPQRAVPPPLDQRPPGLSGLLISEVTVAGTASGPNQVVVLLKGIDKMSYIARPGNRLFDGHISGITGSEVIFIREEVEPGGAKVTSRVVKRVYTEDH
jgi:hypothetical protein